MIPAVCASENFEKWSTFGEDMDKSMTHGVYVVELKVWICATLSAADVVVL